MDWAQKKLKHRWVYDPKQKPEEIPRDYPVPNFGVDPDIAMTQRNMKEAETNLKHKWNPRKDGNGYWHVPSPDLSNRYKPNAFVQVDS